MFPFMLQMPVAVMFKIIFRYCWLYFWSIGNLRLEMVAIRWYYRFVKLRSALLRTNCIFVHLHILRNPALAPQDNVVSVLVAWNITKYGYCLATQISLNSLRGYAGKYIAFWPITLRDLCRKHDYINIFIIRNNEMSTIILSHSQWDCCWGYRCLEIIR